MMNADLVQRLTEAASAAVCNERQPLAYRPEQVHGITLELTIGSDGQVKEAVMFTERRTADGAWLARHTGRAG
jgi:hypothetical protein